MLPQTFITCLLLNFLLSYYAATAKVPAVIVFGDSSVDAGNNNVMATIFKSNFKPYGRDFEDGKPTGRFCNGRLVTDFISQGFGIKASIPAYLDPGYGIQDFATGVTFASAGTGYDNLTSQPTGVIPVWKQLDYFRNYVQRLNKFKGKNNTDKILGEALFIISMGTNDFLLNYFANPLGRQHQFTLGEYENYLIGISKNLISDIYSLGARKIAVSGLPPFGCVPIIRTLNGGACNSGFNKLAADFDEKLKRMIAQLDRELIGVKVLFIDALNPVLHVINNPHAYGIEIVGVACCGTGTFEFGYLCEEGNPYTCMDANKYAFWDAVHLTEKFYHIIADHLMKTTLVQFL